MVHLLNYVRVHCVTDWRILLGIVLTNLWIAVSYLRIPATLRRIVRQVGGRVLGGGEVRGFARFIASCGVTHLFSVVILFAPSADWAAVVWSAWTGYISWRTDKLIRGREAVIVRAILDAHALESRVSGHLGTPRQDMVPAAATEGAE